MSSTVDRPSARQAEAGPRIAIVPLALALSSFLAVSFLLCAIGELIPILRGFHFLKALYPDVDWTRPAIIGIGVLWAFFAGWYVALVFGLLYNFFASKAPSTRS